MLDCCPSFDQLSILETEKSWKRAIHRDQKRVNKHINELRLAISAGNTCAEDYHRNWLLTSPSSKRIAIAQLLREGKNIDVWGYPDVCKLAQSVTLFEPMDEPAFVFAKEKTSKLGFRTIFDFGDRQRVAQKMITNVLSVYLVKRSFQLFDKGVPAAIKDILKKIEGGHVWIAHLDIKNFYPSFTVEGMTEFLPLHPAVVEAALTGRNMVLECAPLPGDLCPIHFIKEARRGLPQGASSSAMVSHLCLSELVVDVAHLEYLFNYEDDLLLLAKSKAELLSMIAAMKGAVGNLPGGQFELSEKSIVHAKDGIDFLGHRISLIDGNAVAEPSEANFARLTGHLLKLETSSGVFSKAIGSVDTSTLCQVSADKISILKSWMSAFQACSNETEIWLDVEGLLADVYSDMKKFGLATEPLPPPTSKTGLKARKFYYYKWFD